MSKPTVSAAGGAMPAEGHKTRRAALRLFAGAPALAVLPVAALASTASPVHPDAALFAMQSAIDAADRELDAALEAHAGPKMPTSTRRRTGRLARGRLLVRRAAGGRRNGGRHEEARRAPSPAWAAYYRRLKTTSRKSNA